MIGDGKRNSEGDMDSREEINNILTSIRSIRSYGWGQLRIIIQDGFITSIEKTFTDKVENAGGAPEANKRSSPCGTRQG